MSIMKYPSNCFNTYIDYNRNRDWTELSNTLVRNGLVIKCNNIAGRNGTVPKPAIINANGYGFNIPTNSKIKKIIVEWEDRRVQYSSWIAQTAYPDIREPTIKFLNASNMGSYTGEKPDKNFTVHRLEIDNPNITSAEINSSNFGVSIEYPSNKNTNLGGLYLNFISVEVVFEGSDWKIHFCEPAIFKKDEKINYDEVHTNINTRIEPYELELGEKMVIPVIIDNPSQSHVGYVPADVIVPKQYRVDLATPVHGSLTKSYVEEGTKIHWTVAPPTDGSYVRFDLWVTSVGIGEPSLKAQCIHNIDYLRTKINGIDPEDLSDDAKMNYGIFRRLDDKGEFELLIDLYIDPELWEENDYEYDFTFRIYDDFNERFITNYQINDLAINPNKSNPNFGYSVSKTNSTITVTIENEEYVTDNHFYWSLTGNLVNFASPKGDYSFVVSLPYKFTEEYYTFYFPFYVDTEPHVELEVAPVPLEIQTPNLVTVSDEGGYCFGWRLQNKFIMYEDGFKSFLENKFKHIGGMKIESSHYDAKYSFTNAVKTSSWKNRMSAGKTGVWNDDLTLNIYLPMVQWKTLEGFSKMDKPVSLELCPRCSDDDVLNHRGWVEIGGIKNVTRVNPHYYKGEIDVTYLSRKYNAKASVIKGARICAVDAPYDLVQCLDYNQKLTTDFTFSGEGQYIFDYTQGITNKIVCNTGQEAHFITKDVVTDYADYYFKWDSELPSQPTEELNDYKYDTIRYNIVDSSNNILLQYQLYDFTTYSATGSVINQCNVVCNMYNDKGTINLANKRIELDYPLGKPWNYGSVTRFEFKGDKLDITESGMNGSELVIRDIELPSSDYRIEVVFDNNDVGLIEPSFVNHLNVKYSLNTLSNKFTNYYRNLIVSPFPIPYLGLLFYRKSSEGLLYYYIQDATSEYLVDGYTQYKGGVDLQTESGASIMYIDNYTSMLYINNGLIKIGFDRNFGLVLFFVYDSSTQKYVYVNTVRVDEFNEFNVVEFTDDKITIEYGKTRWTVWRGHPYVQVEHINADIRINDNYDTVACEGLISPDGYKIYDGFYGKQENYLYNTVTTTSLSGQGTDAPQFLAGSTIKLIGKVYDRYGNNLGYEGEDDEED